MATTPPSLKDSIASPCDMANPITLEILVRERAKSHESLAAELTELLNNSLAAALAPIQATVESIRVL